MQLSTTCIEILAPDASLPWTRRRSFDSRPHSVPLSCAHSSMHLPDRAFTVWWLRRCSPETQPEIGVWFHVIWIGRISKAKEPSTDMVWGTASRWPDPQAKTLEQNRTSALSLLSVHLAMGWPLRKAGGVRPPRVVLSTGRVNPTGQHSLQAELSALTL